MIFSSLPSSTASLESTILPTVCSRQPPQNSCCPLGQMCTISYMWLVLMTKGFLCGSDAKESAYNAGDLGLIPGSERSPGEGNGNPLQYFLPGEFHGQRSLVGYGPWGWRAGHDWATNKWRLRGKPSPLPRFQPPDSAESPHRLTHPAIVHTSLVLKCCPSVPSQTLIPCHIFFCDWLSESKLVPCPRQCEDIFSSLPKIPALKQPHFPNH